MSTALLSKTSYIKSIQCQKHLFLYKNFYHFRDPLSIEKKAIFARGNAVGIYARKLFPEGKDASPKKQFNQVEWIKNTQDLIDINCPIIYEAAFIYNDVFVALDILVKKGEYYYAYEVKSSSKVSPTYKNDASLQYYVISNTGIQLKEISIVYVNSNYIFDKKISPSELFLFENVTNYADSIKQKIELNINRAKGTLINTKTPSIEIGNHCFEPYQCDFKGHCWKHISADSIFDLSGISKKEQFEFYNSGIKSISDLTKEKGLSKLPSIHLKSKTTNKPVVEKQKIINFLKQISYPIFFVDFEAFMPAIPLYPNTKPFEAIPFQFSTHYKNHKESIAVHSDFIAEVGIDPRKTFIENFLSSTEESGNILVYDASSEKKFLKALAKIYPEYNSSIQERIKRIKDLSIPFKNLYYYHYDFKGTHSLKTIASYISEDIDYKTLYIKNGNMAAIIFESLQTETNIFDFAEKRDNLRTYCKMDTLSLVKIFEWLEKF